MLKRRSSKHRSSKHRLSGVNAQARFKQALLEQALFERREFPSAAQAAPLQVVRGQLNNGFAVIRPPGHHAEPGLAGGYCVINNVAVVAAYATAKLGMNRILIVDWVSNEYIFASRFAGSSLIFKLSIVFWLLFAGFFA